MLFAPFVEYGAVTKEQQYALIQENVRREKMLALNTGDSSESSPSSSGSRISPPVPSGPMHSIAKAPILAAVDRVRMMKVTIW